MGKIFPYISFNFRNACAENAPPTTPGVAFLSPFFFQYHFNLQHHITFNGRWWRQIHLHDGRQWWRCTV